MRQGSRTKRTDASKRERFLELLGETANVDRSCRGAGIPRRTVYDWRDTVPGFAEAWEAAVELGTDALEDEAVRRAHEGVLRPVFYQGERCGLVREFSDTLLVVLLKARRPQKYRERLDVEASGKGGGPIRTETELSVAPSTADRLAALLAAGAARRAAGEPPAAEREAEAGSAAEGADGGD